MSDTTPQVVTAEIDAGTVTGAESLYLSTMKFVSAPADTPASTCFNPRLKGVVSYSRRVSCVVWSREKSSGSIGYVDADNTDGALDSLLAEQWRDRDIFLSRGINTLAYSALDEISQAVVDRLFAPDWYTARFALRDKGALLDTAIQQTLYGALANAPELEGTPRPVCIGHCFGVPLVCVHAGDLDYDVHDEAPHGIPELVDNGVILSLTTPPEWSISPAVGVFGPRRLTQFVGKQNAEVEGAEVGSVLIERLPDVVDYLLGRSVVSVADQHYSIDQLDTAAPYDMGLYDRSGLKISDALTQFLDSFCGWWYFDRSGLLRVGRLEEPVGTPVLELSDINLIGDVKVTLDEAKGLSDTVTFARYWAPYSPDGVAGSVGDNAPSRAQLITQPYQTRKGINALHPTYSFAVGATPIKTLLTNDADAQTEADRITALYSTERFFYNCGVAIESELSYTLEPGDVVRLTLDRFGCDAGRLLLVVGVITNLMTSVVQLLLWGEGPQSGDF